MDEATNGDIRERYREWKCPGIFGPKNSKVVKTHGERVDDGRLVEKTYRAKVDVTRGRGLGVLK